MGFFSVDISAALTNPLNLILFAILFVFVLRASKSAPPRPLINHIPEPILLRDFTPQQLLMYDGREGRPLYTAVLNRVYDVTRGAQFYGPDGPYGSFAGHDSSRCLAKHSFSADLMVDPKGPIDKLEDLDDEERQALREWAGHFEFKYDHVGTLVENSQ